MINFTQARIERPELTGRVAAGLDAGAVVVLADAGFGKTTAVEQAVGSNGAGVWLRATLADRDPGRLLSRLAERIRERLPGAAEAHAERLAGALEPVDAITFAENMVEDLGRLLVEPLVIVVDDAEQLAEAPSLAVVDSLLAGSGELIRVAICSRRSLRLRLAKLRATGRLLELGPADLAFTPAECAACLRAVRGADPSSAEVGRLFELTEGWPLGVALAAAAGEDGATPAGRHAIFEYLAEEVVDGLETELGEALEAASIVDELSPDLELGLGLPSGFRGDLVAGGIFVRAHEGDAYSIHPLLREFLRARLAEGSADRLHDLHRRAAAALMASGSAPEAIDHWLEAGAFDEAAAVIAANGIALAGSAPGTVAGWLDRLPAATREQPMLSLLAGRLAMGRGEFEDAVGLCRAAVAAFEEDGAPEAMRWAGRFALTDALIATIDLEAASAASQGAERAGEDAGPAAVFCALTHAGILARLGRHEDSERTLEATLSMAGGRRLIGPGLVAFQAHYRDLPAGRLDEALANVDAGVSALDEADMFNRLPYALVSKMAIHEARGELDRALLTFEVLLEAAARTGLTGYVGAGARLAGATMLAQLGRPEEARVQLERVDAEWSSWAGCDSQVARAVIAARSGAPAEALGHARRGLQEAERMPPFDRVRVGSVLGPVLCDAGEAEEARLALERVLEALDAGESTARTRAALACVLHRAGREAEAHDALAAALSEAGERSRFFVRSEWSGLEPVLWGALESGAVDATTAIAAIEAAFPGGPEVLGFADHPDPAVRERALLAAAAAGNPEALSRAAGSEGDRSRRLVRSPPALAVRTLGGFEVRRGSWRLDASAWERKVAERIVRMLATREGEFVPEDELFEAFWPDRPAESARRGLQTAISSARSAVDLPWEATRLQGSGRAYALVLQERDSHDARDFETAAAAALAAEGAERLPRLEASARLWAGEPLPEERYSDWAASWRERLSSFRADVLSALVSEHDGRGDHASAVRAARALVDLDPLDEHSQRILIGAYASAGRRGDALRQFLECRRALVEELGIEPDAETLALHRRVLAG